MHYYMQGKNMEIVFMDGNLVPLKKNDKNRASHVTVLVSGAGEELGQLRGGPVKSIITKTPVQVICFIFLYPLIGTVYKTYLYGYEFWVFNLYLIVSPRLHVVISHISIVLAIHTHTNTWLRSTLTH